MIKRETTTIKKTMRDVFGVTQFRPGQEEVIKSIQSGQNTLAIMATGAGKSLCYQLPALHFPGTTIVVTPLISLMRDQVDKLEEAGLDAAQVNSSLTMREQDQNVRHIKSREAKFVFTTPERFTNVEFLSTLKQSRIDLVVIDESHCISEWGHDFRPAYLGLGSAIEALGRPPVLALTATATPRVIADIKKQLRIPDMRVINTGIFRPNLVYAVLRATSEEFKRQHLLRYLHQLNGNGIIYCATVKMVQSLDQFLGGSEFSVRVYHGRLRAAEKHENQDRFMNGEVKAMIATNAFGLGIDKPDIRFVIHYQLPGSLEAYYQESGRAGRDGETAHCILFYQLEDRRTQLFFSRKGFPKADDVFAVYEAVKGLRVDKLPVRISEVQERVAGLGKTKAHVSLMILKDAGVVREARYARFKLIKADLAPEDIENLYSRCNEQRKEDEQKLEQMMLYGQSPECRWKLLHDYFKEPFPQQRCGTCDNCVRPLDEQIGIATGTGASRGVDILDEFPSPACSKR